MSAKSQKPPAYIADHIRRVLLDGGSAPHTMRYSASSSTK